MPAPQTPHKPTTLTAPEASRLQACEQTIANGLQTFLAVGQALLTIRDERLYRATHPTFEAYFQERWHLRQSHIYRLMDAAAVVGNLQSSPIGELPTNEAQARPLTRLEPEAQRAAWQEAVATAPGGKVTAAHVNRVVQDYQQEQPAHAPAPAAPQSPPPESKAPAPQETEQEEPTSPLHRVFMQWQHDTGEQLYETEVWALVEQLEDSDHDSYVQWVSALLELATRLDDGETLDDRETTLSTLVGETLGLEGVDECDTDSLRELATRLQAFRPEAWEGRFVPEEADRAALAQGWTRRQREHEIDCAGLLWSYAESGWTVTAIAEATGLSLASVEEWLRYARFLIFLGERATGTTFDPERAALAPEDTTD